MVLAGLIRHRIAADRRRRRDLGRLEARVRVVDRCSRERDERLDELLEDLFERVAALEHTPAEETLACR